MVVTVLYVIAINMGIRLNCMVWEAWILQLEITFTKNLLSYRDGWSLGSARN